MLLLCKCTSISRATSDLREHHVERYTQLLSAMQVAKAWRVCDDGISNEGLL